MSELCVEAIWRVFFFFFALGPGHRSKVTTLEGRRGSSTFACFLIPAFAGRQAHVLSLNVEFYCFPDVPLPCKRARVCTAQMGAPVCHIFGA